MKRNNKTHRAFHLSIEWKNIFEERHPFGLLEAQKLIHNGEMPSVLLAFSFNMFADVTHTLPVGPLPHMRKWIRI